MKSLIGSVFVALVLLSATSWACATSSTQLADLAAKFWKHKLSEDLDLQMKTRGAHH
jgi:hypothetical protein